jgi:hypothetical protein
MHHCKNNQISLENCVAAFKIKNNLLVEDVQPAVSVSGADIFQFLTNIP